MRKKIDRFVIQDVLSEGSSGSVYKAEEQLPGGITRPVALKVLSVIAEGDSKAEQRFYSEVRLCVALSGHPGVVTVYGMGIADRLPWIAMEYVPTVLAQVIGEQPGDPAQVVKMICQVASGLGAIHGLNPPVLHNDLTPSNILVGRLGDHKISDFGLAGPANVERTRVMATVKYAAPELLSRELGPLCPATDLYALGHIAYEMALGGKVYRQQFPAVYDVRAAAKDATPAKWMAWHCSMGTVPAAVHEIRDGFPPAVGVIIAKLMRKPAGERYATAEALLADLRQALNAPPATRPAPMPAPILTPAEAPAEPVVTPQAAPRAPLRAAPPIAANIERYYVRLGGRVSGPFDLPTLQQQIRRGLLSRLHQVSSDRATWQSAGSVEGLFRLSGEETA